MDLIVMRFANEEGEEYLVFREERQAFDHGIAEVENRRPGFTLRGAWELHAYPLNKLYGEFFREGIYQSRAFWQNRI